MAGSSDKTFEGKLDVVVRRVVESDGVVGRRNVGIAGLILSAIGATLLALSVGTLLGEIAFIVGVFLLAIGVQKGRARTRTLTRPAHVLVTAAGVDVEGEPFISAKKIAQAHTQPRADGAPTVRCLDAAGAVVFEAVVGSEAQANRLLRVLARDVARQRQRFEVVPWSGTLLGRTMRLLLSLLTGVVMWCLGDGSAAIVALSAALLIYLGPSLLAKVASSSLEVGADGLLLSSMGRRRFVDYGRVVDVMTTISGVDIKLASGERIPLALAQARYELVDVGLRALAVKARIDEARAAYRRQRSDEELGHRLRRGARSVDRWRRDLAAIRSDEGYRSAATRDEDLWRIVEDAAAPEDARAAAALALRGADDAMVRLRIASEAVASPRLRVALEAASNPEIEEASLDEALASFERPRVAAKAG